MKYPSLFCTYTFSASSRAAEGMAQLTVHRSASPSAVRPQPLGARRELTSPVINTLPPILPGQHMCQMVPPYAAWEQNGWKSCLWNMAFWRSCVSSHQPRFTDFGNRGNINTCDWVINVSEILWWIRLNHREMWIQDVELTIKLLLVLGEQGRTNKVSVLKQTNRKCHTNSS